MPACPWPRQRARTRTAVMAFALRRDPRFQLLPEPLHIRFLLPSLPAPAHSHLPPTHTHPHLPPTTPTTTPRPGLMYLDGPDVKFGPWGAGCGNPGCLKAALLVAIQASARACLRGPTCIRHRCRPPRPLPRLRFLRSHEWLPR